MQNSWSWSCRREWGELFMVMLAGLGQEGHVETPLLALGESGGRTIHSCDSLSFRSQTLASLSAWSALPATYPEEAETFGEIKVKLEGK